MGDWDAIELMDVDGCVVRDEDGVVLAKLHEEDEMVIVKKTPACSLGAYLHIIDYLNELGFDAK